jgi:hypothetical protein
MNSTVLTFPRRTAPSGCRLAAVGSIRGGKRAVAVDPSAFTTRAAEVEAAYAADAEARRVASERADLVEAFVAARGDWTAELRVLAKARRFDDAHPSRDPLYDELHAEQLYGTQYGEAA